MKKIIILSCIAVLSLGKIFAQDHSATDKQDLQDEQKIANQTPARQASIRAERIAEKLHLNPEQTKKLIDAVVRIVGLCKLSVFLIVMENSLLVC